MEEVPVLCSPQRSAGIDLKAERRRRLDAWWEEFHAVQLRDSDAYRNMLDDVEAYCRFLGGDTRKVSVLASIIAG